MGRDQGQLGINCDRGARAAATPQKPPSLFPRTGAALPPGLPRLSTGLAIRTEFSSQLTCHQSLLSLSLSVLSVT